MATSTTAPSPACPIPIFRLGPRAIGQLLLESAKSASAHKLPKMGAALSYYTAFSLAPLVVFIVSLASLVVKKKEASGYIVNEVTNLVGANAAASVQDILTHASAQKLSWGTGISFVILLLGASGAFGELQDSLNQIWEVQSKRHPFLVMIKARALSFAMVFVLGFFMLVSLLFSALIAAISGFVAPDFPAAGLEAVNTFISFLVFTGLFSVIFWMLPDVPLRWGDVWSGAVLSSTLFILGKFLLGWYIGRSTTFSSYGAAGSFVIILVWVFYSAQILYFGAEFAHAYTRRFGSQRGQSDPVADPKLAVPKKL
jgi:membrane protein